jgi:hypothetical protein
MIKINKIYTPGLEYLAQLDELQLNQKVDVLESMYLLIG